MARADHWSHWSVPAFPSSLADIWAWWRPRAWLEDARRRGSSFAEAAGWSEVAPWPWDAPRSRTERWEVGECITSPETPGQLWTYQEFVGYYSQDVWIRLHNGHAQTMRYCLPNTSAKVKRDSLLWLIFTFLCCSSDTSQGGQRPDDNLQMLQDIMVHSKLDLYKPAEMLQYTHEVSRAQLNL